MEIEENYLKEAKNRARFFQTVQAWPLDEELNSEGWLGNFTSHEEKEIACMLLDFFNYYSSKMVAQMLKSSVSNAGYVFSKHFPNWSHSDFKNRCFYSFIPGEDLNPTDSGHIFTRLLRDELEVPELRIVSYTNVSNILHYAKEPLPIVFVDDFVGSGAQVLKAWEVNTFPFNNKSLSVMCQEGGHCIVYAPLFVNDLGSDTLSNDCKGLHVSATHILGKEYNLFDESCICWKNDKSLYLRGTELILAKSKMLGIPFTNGRSVNDVRGFGNQALAFSFQHGTPDATLPLFYWNANGWVPLVRKIHQR